MRLCGFSIKELCEYLARVPVIANAGRTRCEFLSVFLLRPARGRIAVGERLLALGKTES